MTRNETTKTERIARIAMAIPKLRMREQGARRELKRYVNRYGATQSAAHRRLIAAVRRAESNYCRAYNLVGRYAGTVWNPGPRDRSGMGGA